MSRYSPNQIYKVVKTADNRFDKNEYKKSLEGYKKALTMKPNKDIESHCYLKIGLSQQFLENLPDALGAFDKSISIQKSFLGYFYKGILLLSLKQYKESEDSLKQALKLNTNDKNAVITYVNLGRVYIIQNKIKESLKVLKNALDINENEINALLLMAECYKQQNNIDEAKKTYEKILSFNQNKDAIIGLGSIYLESKDEQKAISLLKNYLQNHQDPELFKIKGEIHFSLNDNENALTNFKKSKKLFPNESINLEEARCLLALKRTEEAFTVVKEYISSTKSSILSKIFLAELYAKTNQISMAVEALNELIQTESIIQTNSDLSQKVANVLLLCNEYEKAEKLFENINTSGVQNWSITKQLVVISIEKKDYSLALERIEKLYKLAENISQIGHSYHLHAIIFFRLEMYADCENIIEKGLNELKKNKNDQYFILELLLSKTKLKLNKTLEAEEIIKSILEDNPQMRSIIEADSDLKLFLK